MVCADEMPNLQVLERQPTRRAIPGAILGSLLGQLLSACGVRNHSTVRLTFLGAYLGAGISAFQLDTEAAISGSAYGFLGGAGVFLLGYALMSWVRSRLPRP